MIGILCVMLLLLLCLGDLAHPRPQTRQQARKKARTQEWLRRRKEDEAWRQRLYWYHHQRGDPGWR